MIDIRKRKFEFRPRARLLQLLGDQLITDARIAVFELVKNAYDADAPAANVIFRDIDDRSAASIIVEDSGQGMDLETVTGVWLEPGADHREKQRLAGNRTPKFGRLPLGEKGVGRFAAHKIGRKISLVTRSSGEKEVVVEIDWDTLIKSTRYLADAKVDVETRVPEIFTGKQTGTRIEITGLRNMWTKGEVRKLYRSINSIASAFNYNDDFKVNFAMEPDRGWTEGLTSAKDIAEEAMFYYDFTIEGSTFSFDYKFEPLPGIAARAKKRKAVGLMPREINKKDQPLAYPTIEVDENGKRKRVERTALVPKKTVGRITGRLLGFDRDREVLKFYEDARGLAEHLDQNGGIRVYRDGIRVYNYGEPGNDWLGLDERRVQVPSRRVGNNLILGEVQLDLATSAGLVEKTNREGFVENRDFEQFKEAVLCAAIRFENERAADKEKIREVLDPNVPNDPDFPVIRGPEQAIDALRVKIKNKGWTKELEPYIDKVEETYQEVRDTLLNASSATMGLTVVFHEMERGVRDLYKAIDSNKADKARVTALARHLVDLLEGVSFFVRKSSTKMLSAAGLVRAALFTLAPRFEYHKIEVTNAFKDGAEDYQLRGSERMLGASIVNLIDNAIYWLNADRNARVKKGQNPPIKRIWIGPWTEGDEHGIVVADNGPGLEEEPDVLVRPFFTLKRDGMGLGLYFVNMTMTAHSGRLDFPKRADVDVPRAFTGAVIAMVFPARRK